MRRSASPPGATVLVLCDQFPVATETFVWTEIRALREAGLAVRVEALATPRRPAEVAEHARNWEDDPTWRRLLDMGWLAARRPRRCIADLRARRRWRRDEPVVPLRMLAPAARRIHRRGERHLHVHFAAGAALAALRLSRLLDVPFSVTAHAYDIYATPANLPEKLRRAAFATSGCEYTVAHLREIAGPGAAERIHKIVMGVDGDAFRRRSPLPGGRTVIAVGRLVEKKGFADLIDAVALMRDAGDPPDRVVIVGDGPLRAGLAARVAERELEGVVELPGGASHDRTRELLEQADVLAMPCVVAADGDRDSMPVVVKEALAMEIPVVATNEVGLPEVVRPQWGDLAPPGDPPALADALRRELSRPVEERAARGRAGRAHVLEHCNPVIEARRLAALIRSHAGHAPGV